MKRDVTQLLKVLSLSASGARNADFAACLQALTLEFNGSGIFGLQVQLKVEELKMLQPGLFSDSRGAQQRDDILNCISTGGFAAVVIWLPPPLSISTAWVFWDSSPPV